MLALILYTHFYDMSNEKMRGVFGSLYGGNFYKKLAFLSETHEFAVQTRLPHTPFKIFH